MWGVVLFGIVVGLVRKHKSAMVSMESSPSKNSSSCVYRSVKFTGQFCHVLNDNSTSTMSSAPSETTPITLVAIAPDGVQPRLQTLSFPSLAAAHSYVCEERKCSHLLYCPFSERIGLDLHVYVDMARAAPLATASHAGPGCGAVECCQEQEPAVDKNGVKLESPNSAAILLTFEPETGNSAFAGGPKIKRLRGTVFAVRGSLSASSSSGPSSVDREGSGGGAAAAVVAASNRTLTSDRVAGVMLFIREQLRSFVDGTPAGERREIFEEQAGLFADGLWEPEEAEGEVSPRLAAKVGEGVERELGRFRERFAEKGMALMYADDVGSNVVGGGGGGGVSAL